MKGLIQRPRTVGKFSFPPMPRQESLGHDSSVVVSGSPSLSTRLSQLQIWPVGFGPSGEIIVRDEGRELWDGLDGDSPIPLKVYHPMGSSLVEWDDRSDDSFLDPLDWPYSDEEDPPLPLLKRMLRWLGPSTKAIGSCSI
jgi:hypothetical protein